MCGIFGYSFIDGSIGEGRLAIFAQRLGMLNDARGGHSWGLTEIGADGKLTVRRGLGDVRDHMHHVIGAMTMFGHTRWGTHGDKTIANAHPFEIGDIVGAHNGVLYNHDELCKAYARDFAVDSMHLFAHLDTGLPFEDIEGYGAIEWVDRREGQYVKLCKLLDGELAVYGIGKDTQSTSGIVWSSDDEHLDKALKAAGLRKHFAYRVDEGQVYAVHSGALWQRTGDKLNLSKGFRPRLKWSDFRDHATMIGGAAGFPDGADDIGNLLADGDPTMPPDDFDELTGWRERLRRDLAEEDEHLLDDEGRLEAMSGLMKGR